METQTVNPPANKNGEITKLPNNNSIVDNALARINQLQENGGLQLPKDYSAGNSLRAAYLILQEVKTRDSQPVLKACTQISIANALLKMVVQGLNPIKRQCSFIAYGDTLICQREYQGSIAIAKRYGLKSIVANAIFKGEEFAYEVDTESGKKKVTKHTSSFESYGGEVIGAYAIIEMNDGSKNVEIMNMKQIQAAWNQGATKGQSPAHKNFPDQMACKTVINRAVKTIINSSDDADLFEDETITQNETPFTAEVKQEINNNANGEAIGFDDEAEDVTPNDHTEGPAENVPVETSNTNAPAVNQKSTQTKAPF